jgi:hypothetical protein
MQKNIYLCDMEKEFVIYSLALRMKKLGYNGSCFAFYQVENFEEKPCGVDDRDEYIRTGFATCKNSEIPEHFTSAPTYSQAFRWFREKYDFSHSISKTYRGQYMPYVNGEELLDMDTEKKVDDNVIDDFGYKWLYDSYEEAETACLQKLIEIVEQTNAEMTEHGVYK